ncbi:MAG: sensor domain-containing diguanylate cyclase [Bacillota bacterium]
MAGRVGHIFYTWLIILLGFGILARLFGALNLDLGRGFLIMIALGMLAEWLGVSFPQGRLTGGFAVVLSSYLIYGPAAAAWISALAALFSQGIANRGNPFRTALFNAAQYVPALLAADHVYARLGGQRGAGLGLADLVPLLAFIAVYFLVNHLQVYLYLLPGRRRYPLLAWADAFRWDALTYLFGTPFGVLMSLLYQQVGVAGSLLLFLPVLIVQFVLRLYVHVELANRELFALYQVAKKLNERLALEDILEIVLKEARRIVSYHSGVIYLWSEERGAYAAAAAAGAFAESLRRSAVPKGEGFLGQAMENRTPEIVFDARSDPRLKKEPGLPQVYRSLLVIPLLSEKETLGALVIGDKRPLAFDEHHLHTLGIIGGQAAIAVMNALLVRRLEHSANTDALTGIYNHRYFCRQIEGEHRRAKEAGRSLGLVMLDVDSFKSINDRYGHQAGDAVLCELARVIRDAVGEKGVVARYGGEEFVIALPGLDEEDCLDLAEQIRETVRGHYFPVDGLPRQVRVSLGVAVFPRHAQDVAGLIKKADRALYKAKEAGKDRVVSASALL